MEFSHPPGQFANQPFYAAHFMDPVIWQPFVQRVCQQHGFDCKRVNPGLPGTYPTFIAEVAVAGSQSRLSSLVVKFFGPLYGGADAFLVEQALGNTLVQQSLPIHSPAILAQGRLSVEWCYLIFEHIPGGSIGQVREQLSVETWMSVAYQMGVFMRALHAITANQQSIIPIPAAGVGWEGFADFLEKQRSQCFANHKQWGDLPAHLLGQIPGYIPRVDELLDLSSSPHLIHADLTADHVLGRQVNHDWQTLAIIDWGDTRLGNILYELVALHIDLFQGDRRLLQRCLKAYRLPVFYQHEFAHKAFSMVLLHQFPMPASIYAAHQEVPSLDVLAERLFGVEFEGGPTTTCIEPFLGI
jgi:hygromycin-B 7''-O-kinase